MLHHGYYFETKACQFLMLKGLNLLYRNYRSIYGEIDLIMQDQTDIVFVEVRQRHHIDYGNALESIHAGKIKKLTKTAIHFLQKKKWLYSVNSRFDLVLIHTTQNDAHFEWIKNAFTVD